MSKEFVPRNESWMQWVDPATHVNVCTDKAAIVLRRGGGWGPQSAYNYTATTKPLGIRGPLHRMPPAVFIGYITSMPRTLPKCDILTWGIGSLAYGFDRNLVAETIHRMASSAPVLEAFVSPGENALILQDGKWAFAAVMGMADWGSFVPSVVTCRLEDGGVLAGTPDHPSDDDPLCMVMDWLPPAPAKPPRKTVRRTATCAADIVIMPPADAPVETWARFALDCVHGKQWAYAARPYLEYLRDGCPGYEGHNETILRALSNLSCWRGDAARATKAALKAAIRDC